MYQIIYRLLHRFKYTVIKAEISTMSDDEKSITVLMGEVKTSQAWKIAGEIFWIGDITWQRRNA